MATEFALWLSTQDILIQLIVYIVMFTMIALLMIFSKRADEKNEEKEFREFVLAYYSRNIKLQRWTILVHLCFLTNITQSNIYKKKVGNFAEF